MQINQDNHTHHQQKSSSPAKPATLPSPYPARPAADLHTLMRAADAFDKPAARASKPVGERPWRRWIVWLGLVLTGVSSTAWSITHHIF